MCGIAGFLEPRATTSALKSKARHRLNSMLGAIRHRGPDDWGMTFFGVQTEALVGDGGRVTWLPSPEARLALGHQRLSILDLRPAGRQPMMSRDGTLCLTFNGEIYNYIELRAELSRHAEFYTETDTEVLLEAYRQWGVAMLGRLDGMFAFALWDAREEKLLCVRDPLGIKPFYFAVQDGLFLFASEPRAVLAGLGVAGRIDPVRLAEFLALGISDHDEGTSYQEVRQLRGGHWFAVSPRDAISEPRPFWEPPRDIISEEANVPVLVRERIDLAVRRQLRSDVPVGSCLSGGLDSGSIVATIGEVLSSQAAAFTTLTLSSQDFEGDESTLARTVAQCADVNWQRVEPELGAVAEEIEDMVGAMDEPFPSLSMFGQRKVMQQAHALGLKVMLDGQGGDEVFLGYLRVAQRVLADYFSVGRIASAWHEWRGLQRNALQPLARSLLGNIFFGSPRLLRRRNIKRAARLVEPALLEQARAETAYQMYSSQSGGVQSLQSGELTRFCLPQLLRFEDRNSMAYGVEARVPLLSLGLVELGLCLPLHWKVRDGWTKYALRAAMQDRLPAEIVWGRRKRGFEVPQRQWIEAARPQIARWITDLPRDCPVKGSQLLAYIDAGQAGEEWVWRCLSVALWMRFSEVRF